MKRALGAISVVASCVVCAAPAAAQTTGGVFGPGVSAQDRSAQWRIALSPGEDGGADRWASRLHYQHGFTDSLRGRIVLQGSDIETGEFETVFAQAELQWQFKSGSDWASALRFDARVAENDDGADQLGLNWTNQWSVAERTSLTGVVLTNVQIGNRRADGVGVELRGALAHRLDGGATIAVDSFNSFGRSVNFGRFKGDSYRLGPRVSGRMGDIDMLAGVLFGLGGDARDTDFRVWLGKRFN